MANVAISYGTAVWLADLKREGWNLTASEHLAPSTVTVRCVEDEFEPLDFLAPVRRVGVFATPPLTLRSAVFVPCRDKDAAYRLLERVDDEVDGIV